jgi:hypothetical protein
MPVPDIGITVRLDDRFSVGQPPGAHGELAGLQRELRQAAQPAGRDGRRHKIVHGPILPGRLVPVNP